MNKPLYVCPGTLATGFTTYSPRCCKLLFGGRRVSHVLPYSSRAEDAETEAAFITNRERISISGVQEKLSLVLDGRELRLAQPAERGTYLLKPIPRDLRNVRQVPANEHLTMQIARQVYGLSVAENALIFFNDGVPAYLTKRFDYRPDGKKWGVEDFAALAGKTVATGGSNYKYAYSYEAIGALIRRFLPTWRIVVEVYFQLVVFNYLFSNGDAHLKNFSILETPQGDYTLSPAYDLINTQLHVADTDFALSKGLFEDNTPWQNGRYATAADFLEFAQRIGVQSGRALKLLQPFQELQSQVETLVERSFLDAGTQRGYLLGYRTRRNRLVQQMVSR